MSPLRICSDGLAETFGQVETGLVRDVIDGIPCWRRARLGETAEREYVGPERDYSGQRGQKIVKHSPRLVTGEAYKGRRRPRDKRGRFEKKEQK